MSKEQTSIAKRKPGRPRSELARKTILRAAYDLVEEIGPARVTVEAIAARAGVGKPTIYRSWANAQEVVLASMIARSSSDAETDTPSGLDDLYALVDRVIERFSASRGRQITVMLASAEPDSELFKAFRNQVILKGRTEGKRILKDAVEHGDLRADLDVDATLDMIFGAVFLRLLLQHEPLNTAFGRSVIDQVLGRG